jgi:hypothetical protein
MRYFSIPQYCGCAPVQAQIAYSYGNREVRPAAARAPVITVKSIAREYEGIMKK